MRLDDIAHRSRMIGLSSAALARRAGVDKFTVYRAFRGSTGTLLVNASKIASALEASERALLDHLLTLYPHAAPPAAAASPVAPSLPAGEARLSHEVAA